LNRRWIPTVPTSKAWGGAYATKWEGFSKAWIREYGLDRGLYKWNPRRIDYDGPGSGVFGIEDIDDVCGVYVFLANNNYVLYVGMSTRLGSEIASRYKRFEGYKRKHIHQVVAHKALSADFAKRMETDLLWYYTPPWNTRFD